METCARADVKGRKQQLKPEFGHVEEQANEASKRWVIRRLEQLGYQVSLQSEAIA
jgi:hypothetical protein